MHEQNPGPENEMEALNETFEPSSESTMPNIDNSGIVSRDIKRKDARKKRLVSYVTVVVAAALSCTAVSAGFYLIVDGKVNTGVGLISSIVSLWIPSPTVLMQ